MFLRIGGAVKFQMIYWPGYIESHAMKCKRFQILQTFSNGHGQEISRKLIRPMKIFCMFE